MFAIPEKYPTPQVRLGKSKNLAAEPDIGKSAQVRFPTYSFPYNRQNRPAFSIVFLGIPAPNAGELPSGARFANLANLRCSEQPSAELDYLLLENEFEQMIAIWKQLNDVLENPEKLTWECWSLIGITFVTICYYCLRSKPYV